MWNFFHHWMGRAGYVIAVVNFYYGVQLFGPTVGTYVWAFVGPVIAAVLFICEDGLD
jgi:hypothetical protein